MDASSAIAQLCARIEDAFSNVVYPGDENIVLTEWGTDVETSMELADDLRGKHWRDLLSNSDEWFTRSYDAMVLLSPEGFHFYLPAFLIKTLQRDKDLDLLPDWIIYSFEPPNPADEIRCKDFTDRMSRFNQAQRNVLISYLEAMKEFYREQDSPQQHILNAQATLSRYGAVM